ncbi:hypothetical protein QBC40DRAFT_349122 [Triangularia verruculosa]|uniref:Uncharacterized protein n=1 Tax=Triangularia verruculosa TaxID=2587418 RepID=A0AAN6XI99_9PEZI|nr:hypothetical protein QBC40DRAFT_349122 [Triangularia verruculosa]
MVSRSRTRPRRNKGIFIRDYVKLRPDQQSVILPPPVEQLGERLEYICAIEEFWEEEFSRLTECNPRLWAPFNDLQKVALFGINWGSMLNAVSSKNARTEDIMAGAVLVPHFLKVWWSRPAGEGDEYPIFRDGLSKRTPPHHHLKRLDHPDSERPPPLHSQSFQRPDYTIHHRIISSISNQNSTRNKTLIEWCLTTYGWVFFYPGKALKGGAGFKDRDKIAQKLFAASSTRTTSDDTNWNVVAVDPKLHSLWERGLCAFRCLGAERIAHDAELQDSGKNMIRITLEFHWMPVVDREAVGETIGDLLKLGEIMGKTYGDDVGEELGFVSGERWYVEVESQHTKELIMSFCIQWSVIVMTALAGGPRAFDAVPDSPPDWFLEDGGFKGASRLLPTIHLGP